MASFKISTLIKTILFLLCFILVITSAFSFKSMSQASDSFNEMKTLTQNLRELRRMSTFLGSVRGDINYVYNDPTASHEVLAEKAAVISEGIKNAQRHASNFQRAAENSEEGKVFSNNVYNKFNALIENYTNNMRSLEAYNNTGFDNGKLENALDDAVQEYADYSVKVESNITDKFSADRLAFLITSGILLALTVCISCLSFILIKRFVFNRLQTASSMLDKISSGELFHEFETGARNEIGVMLESLQNMKGSLSGIITSVRLTSGNIRTDASEIDTGNHDLASRTEEQASALQQTAASMEEIKTTVSNNAENARQANLLSQQARTTADNGSSVMANVVSTMDKISKSARKISEINGVIDGIANQTNILALNAAVEAARAGEQGRGFSVVASEVRNLAARSADAAKEINLLINESVKNVDDGARLIEDAGKTMHEIVTSVTHVSNIMQEITQASEEQSTGVSQIAMAVNEMDLATQQNAAMVEESSVITQNLNNNARHLFDIVSFFRVEKADNATQPVTQESAHGEPVRQTGRIKKNTQVKEPAFKKDVSTTEGAWTEF
jgi:methyl-accepting chemotaxis protein